MAKAARTTISIPADLKARMEAVDEPINWSAVAARAFEQELAKRIQIRGARDMQEVIDRLKASKRSSDDKRYLAGLRDGETWAKTEASAEELERLEAFVEANTFELHDFSDWLDVPVDAPLDHAGWIVMAIDGLSGDTGLASQHADAMFGEVRSKQQVLGFVNGAMGVWNKVKDQI